MKKALYILLITVMIFSLCSCRQTGEADKGKKWDCSVVNTLEDETVIVYNDTELQTDSGSLCFQNRNEFTIQLYLYSNDAEEVQIMESDIQPYGVLAFTQVNPDYTYRIGVHADVEEGTAVNIMVYDGDAWQEPYSIQSQSGEER